MKKRPSSSTPQCPYCRKTRSHNRVAAIMAHTTRYSFRAQSRLAKDTGLSPGAISRFLAGYTKPSVDLLLAVTKALSKHTGKDLSPLEIYSPDGTYPTPSVCELLGCKGDHPYE